MLGQQFNGTGTGLFEANVELGPILVHFVAKYRLWAKNGINGIFLIFCLQLCMTKEMYAICSNMDNFYVMGAVLLHRYDYHTASLLF